MKTLSRRAALVFAAGLSALVFALLASPPCAAQQFDENGRWVNGVSEPWYFAPEQYSKEEVAAAQELWHRIAAERADAQANEWEGDYFTGGETHGTYLRWSRRSGFVLLSVNKCAAEVMSFDYGKVVAGDTLVRLLPALKRRGEGAHGAHGAHVLPSVFLPVRWQGAHFLVPEGEVADFADYAAGLGEYNSGLSPYLLPEQDFFFVKGGVEDAGAPDELPVFPPGYEHAVKRPIDAVVTAVGRRVVMRDRAIHDDTPQYKSETPITLDVGRVHGVRPRMSFYVLGNAEDFQVTVSRVGARTSTAVVSRHVGERRAGPKALWPDYEARKYPPITPGWKLSTSWQKYLASRKDVDSAGADAAGLKQ